MAQDARNCVGGCETEMVMVMAMPRGVLSSRGSNPLQSSHSKRARCDLAVALWYHSSSPPHFHRVNAES
jgi:hypothetical protein